MTQRHADRERAATFGREIDSQRTRGAGLPFAMEMIMKPNKTPRRVVSDDALYFTDNGRIVCGAHCGMSAAYTGRDISGQKIERVTPETAASWLAEVGEPIACEDCAHGVKVRS